VPYFTICSIVSKFYTTVCYDNLEWWIAIKSSYYVRILLKMICKFIRCLHNTSYAVDRSARLSSVQKGV
jgi:hypothetical protein